MLLAAETAIDEAIMLMRRAANLLDAAERSVSADFVQHAIAILEEEIWASAGVHAAHERRQ